MSMIPLKKRRAEGTIMSNSKSLPLKKRLSCRYWHDFEEEFTMDEYEACDALLSLKTPTFNGNGNGNVNVNLNGGNENHHLLDLPPVLDSLRGYIDVCSKSFEKKLCQSDLCSNQQRLFLYKKQVERCILPMLRGGENAMDGVPVTAYDMSGNMFNMEFKMWTQKFYVLGRGWNTFRKAHALKKENVITVWVFRHLVTDNLCFVIGITRTDDGNGLNDSHSSTG